MRPQARYASPTRTPRPFGSKARRDAVTVAEAAEAHAERVNTNDAWLVAADAWEEASVPNRTRFAYLRQPRLHSGLLLTNAEAASIRRRYDAWSKVAGRQTPAEMAKISAPTNNEVGLLEIYEFLRDPPTHLFAYYDSGGAIHTFTSGLLGTIVSRGKTARAFGSQAGPRLQYVTVRAINGYYYSGRCNLDTGDYCKLKRGKAWLRR